MDIHQAHKSRIKDIQELEKLKWNKKVRNLETKPNGQNQLISTFHRHSKTKGLWRLETTQQQGTFHHKLFPPDSSEPSSAVIDEIDPRPQIAGGMF